MARYLAEVDEVRDGQHSQLLELWFRCCRTLEELTTAPSRGDQKQQVFFRLTGTWLRTTSFIV